MPRHDNERLVRRLYDDYINRGHLDRLGEVVAADFVGPGGRRGPAAFAATIEGLRAGFPDLSYTLEEVVADDASVAVRWTLRGTHSGTFRNIAPTGKRIENNGMAIFRVASGKIAAASVETDRLGFLLAIGKIPYDPAFGPSPREAFPR
jgi:predicted ester cyclase